MSGDIAGLFGGEAVSTDHAEAATGFDALPPGWYPVLIDSAEIKDTKAGNGKYLKLGLSVVGEKFANRKLWPNINLQNPNPKAVEIGMRELAGLGQACGLTAISDTAELVNKQIDVRVKIGKARDGYEPGNEVTAYALPGSKTSGAQAPAARPPASAAASDAPKRPWER